MCFLNRQLASNLAPFPIRLVFGIIFLAHGMTKFALLAANTRAFAHLGIPLPTLVTPAIAALEVIGGLTLILGLGWGTRVVAFLLTITMLVAIMTARRTAGFIGGYEYNLALIAGLLTLVLSGPGPFALIREKIPASTT